ncbi:histone deacetylase 6 isoform X1 [Anabrus simplex]|uniref:histone deacetylase 6 isoform X1 n=3 Tax=Anabrus simplex TaxID=316456 RepID=UPI0034DDC7DA
MPTILQMAEKVSRTVKRDDTIIGTGSKRGTKKMFGEGVRRRSPRFNEKARPAARPSAAIIEAKRNARQKQVKKHEDLPAVRDPYQTAREAKEIVRRPTGIIYDKRMVEHHCLWDPDYPECPDRFTRVLERCESLGLISRCLTITPREATESEILVKHTSEQIEILKATDGCTDEIFLEKLSSKYDAIYIHPSSYRLSLLSAGSAIELVDAICSKKVQNGMAIIRPPGHHAMKSEYCGYCFFNNVALAAHHALENCKMSRILIVDWDVHHGQATQQMFYDDPRVVYFSIHRYEHGSFWPNLRESNFNYIGTGKGTGYNFNIPLNKTGMKDADYLAVFQQVLLPMAYEFQPELVLVSAGYDAAIGCPEGEMEITPVCYSHLLSSLLGLASGKVAVILEGGYCLQSLAEGAALTLRCLLGDPCPPLPPLDPPCDSIQETILDVIYAHREHWQCFQFQETYQVGIQPEGPILNSVSACGIEDEKKQKEDSPKSGVLRNRHYPVVKFMGSEDRPESYLTRNCYPVQSDEFKCDVEARLNSLIINTNLSFAQQRVCFVYDERMMKHKNISDPSHPERPERLSSIYSCLEDYGLLERCHQLQSRSATKEELLLLHSKAHIEQMEEAKNLKLKELNKLEENFRSLYLHPASYDSACLSAGCLLQVVDSVLNGESRSGIAIVRPPGHHAEEDEPCGFCIFNSVSLAAKYAVEVHGLKRVLLLDWDVHHGNGSQKMFKSDPRVLYLSLHRYDNGSFFPGSKDANYTVVGSGPGLGFNVNIPWNKRGISDGDYVAAFHQVVLPICYQFDPELVLVSAGFDAAVGDPLGGLRLTPEVYSHMTHWLSALANGKIVLSLEGGYNLTSISYAMTLCTKALLGDPLPPLRAGLAPCLSAVTTIKNVIHTQSQYWPCLKFDVALPKRNVLLDNVRPQVPVSPDTITLSKSLTKLNLDEEVSSSDRISKETIYSNFCIIDVARDRETCVESPMELSESSINFVASSSNSSFEGDSIAWSRVSSVSFSESPEELVVENNIRDTVESYCPSPCFISDLENSNVPVSETVNLNSVSLASRPSSLPIACDSVVIKNSRLEVRDAELESVHKAADKEAGSSGGRQQSSSSQGGHRQSGSSQGGQASGGAPPGGTLADYLSDNIQLLLAGEMHAVIPLRNCPHLDRVEDVPAIGIDCKTPCLECGSVAENWVCLICYTVHCGRYVNEHMVNHGVESSHPLTLSFTDLSVWCYGCDAYVDNDVLYNAKNAAHRSKFGEDLPWTYGD